MAVLGAGRSMCLEALGVSGGSGTGPLGVGIRGGERMSRYARPEAGSRGRTRAEFGCSGALTVCRVSGRVTLPSERPPLALRQPKETLRQ